MPNYFSKFPKIAYKFSDGTAQTLVDINVKFSLSDIANKTTEIFYPYEWKDSDRVDIVADKYYDSDDFYWLVMLSNGAYDINHDMAMPSESFERYVINKYKDYLERSSIFSDADSFNGFSGNPPKTGPWDAIWDNDWYDAQQDSGLGGTVSWDAIWDNDWYDAQQDSGLGGSDINSYILAGNPPKTGPRDTVWDAIWDNDWYDVENEQTYSDEKVLQFCYQAVHHYEDDDGDWVTYVTNNPVTIWEYEMEINERKREVNLISNERSMQIKTELEDKLKTIIAESL